MTAGVFDPLRREEVFLEEGVADGFGSANGKQGSEGFVGDASEKGRAEFGAGGRLLDVRVGFVLREQEGGGGEEFEVVADDLGRKGRAGGKDEAGLAVG